jgi:L-amino acid N-acyltransferase YncA
MEQEIKIIADLPVDRWQELKELRIEAVKSDSVAFSTELDEALAKPDSDWKETLEGSLNGDQFVVFAELNGKLVGMIRAYLYKKERFKHNASLQAFYVSTDVRGTGIGAKLMDKAIELIKSKGYIKYIITEVFSSQIASIKVHEKLGFEIVGRYKNFVKIDDEYFDSVYFQKQVG